MAQVVEARPASVLAANTGEPKQAQEDVMKTFGGGPVCRHAR